MTLWLKNWLESQLWWVVYISRNWFGQRSPGLATAMRRRAAQNDTWWWFWWLFANANVGSLRRSFKRVENRLMIIVTRSKLAIILTIFPTMFPHLYTLGQYHTPAWETLENMAPKDLTCRQCQCQSYSRISPRADIGSTEIQCNTPVVLFTITLWGGSSIARFWRWWLGVSPAGGPLL